VTGVDVLATRGRSVGRGEGKADGGLGAWRFVPVGGLYKL
jgi:hypothetical protein